MKPVRDTIPMSLFGARIKELRRGAKMTQQAVADRLRIDRTTYTKYETGRVSPDHQGLLCLAQLFGVTVDYLLGREDEPAELAVAESRESAPALTEQEMLLLQMFRQLSKEEQGELVKRAQAAYRERRK